MHGMVHRESQGSLIYQIKRHIFLKKIAISGLLIDFKGLLYLNKHVLIMKNKSFSLLLEGNLFHKFPSSRQNQEHLLSLCGVSGYLCWDLLQFSVPSVTRHDFCTQTSSPSTDKSCGTVA